MTSYKVQYLVCMSVCYYTSCYTISKQKTRYHRLLYGIFLDFDSWITPKRLRSGAMPVFASLDDCGSLLSIQITPVVLDTARIDIIYEALAIPLTITKVEQLS